MKAAFFLLVLLSCATLGHAQTTPAPTSSSQAPAASGTKNVGADRADAPQAPGMQQPAVTIPSRRPSGMKAKKSRGSRPATSGSATPAPQL